ncbi:MerR family transcriptional regulator [Saccharopolyspora taberi]|uniref:MerR family transcriptional regulator n=1 Tax=Saccharopolyspora taberi TaxID=60895 RepID=A0ABN3VQW7_9PSEU
MRIGELAAATGVSVRALRYYEEQNLLTSCRSRSGQRHYPDSAADRVRLIQELYAAGIPSRKIAELLPCIETGEITPALLDRLTAERDRIDGRIHELIATRDRLDAAIDAAANAMRQGVPCPRPKA